MSGAGDASPSESKAELRVVGTSVTHETEALLDRLAASVGRRTPRVLQVGSRTSVADRNVRNWRSLVASASAAAPTSSASICWRAPMSTACSISAGRWPA